MKAYPSIEGISAEFLGRPCVAFQKLDGSNLRVEYSRKRGWYKWGTRRRLFDKTDPEYGSAIALFEQNYAEPLAQAIDTCKEFRGNQGAIAFLEYFGPDSFAGQHQPGDSMELRLIDVNINKKGLVEPRLFIRTFGEKVPIPDVVYDGILTEGFIKDVREGKYPVMEGVVCKGGEGHNLWMVKIKTWAYLAELKGRLGQQWRQYWE